MTFNLWCAQVNTKIYIKLNKQTHSSYMIILCHMCGVLYVSCHVEYLCTLVQFYTSITPYLYTLKIKGYNYLLKSN